MSRRFPAMARAACGSLLAVCLLGALSPSASALEWSTATRVSPDGLTAKPLRVVVADDGSATAFFGADDAGEPRIGASTRLAGSTTWSTPTFISPGNTDISEFVNAASTPDGSVTVIWRRVDTGDIQVATRPAGSAVFGTPATVLTGVWASIAATPGGSLVAVAVPGGSGEINVSTLEPGGGSAWSAPVTLVSDPGNTFHFPVVTSDLEGNVYVAALRVGSSEAVVSARLPAGSEDWSPVETVATDNIEEEGNLLELVPHPNGDVTASWQTDVVPGKGFDPLRVSTRDVITGSWSTPADLTGTGTSGFWPRLLVDRTGSLSAFWTTNPFQIGTSDRDQFGAWTPSSLPAAPGNFGYPSPFLSATGNPIVLAINSVDFSNVDLTVRERTGGTWGSPQTLATAAILDAGLPAFGGNRYGGIAAAWTSETDDSVYVIETAGDYSPHAPAPDPVVTPVAPETEAPIAELYPPLPEQSLALRLAPIEARLVGKTIQVNARLTLKPRKRCKGRATARTKVGKRKYRARLRLRSRFGVCRATGTIRLRKKPSKKAKLRLKITSRASLPISVRTLPG